MNRIVILGILVVLPLTVLPAGGQGPKAIVLPPANGRVEGEFATILSLVELADGRVLMVATTGSQSPDALLVGDFRTGAVVPAARHGHGPGEFDGTGSLVDIGRDSVIMPISMEQRALLFVGGKIVGSLNRDAFRVRRRIGWGVTEGADHLGHLLAVCGPYFRASKIPSPQDSLSLVRINRATGRVDTVAHLAPPSEWVDSVPHDYVPPKGSFGSATDERGVMFPDGWVAVVRANPFRVELWSPNGKHVRGPVAPFTSRGWTDADKRTFMEWTWAHWEIEKPVAPAQSSGWPDAVGPFTSLSPILAAPDGTLWVTRTPTGADPKVTIDVFDRTGSLAGRVKLPLSERVIGFGAHSIYVVSVDGDNVQRLVRHPWP